MKPTETLPRGGTGDGLERLLVETRAVDCARAAVARWLVVLVLLFAALLATAPGCRAPHEGQSSYVPPAVRSRTFDDREAARDSEAIAVPGEAAPPGPAAAQGPRSTRPLSLDDCIQIALSENRSIRMADRHVLMAHDRYFEAMTDLFPRVFVEGRYSARNNDQGARFMDEAFVMGDRDSGTIKVSALVPIYTFGRVGNRMDAETFKGQAAEFTSRRTRQELTLSVSLAYFRVLEAKKIQGVVEESIRVVRRQLEIARDFFQQGLVARNDVLSLEVQLAERQQELIQARNNVQLASATLSRVMGADVNEEIPIQDVLEAKPWKGSFEDVVRLAVGRDQGPRPDLRALQSQVDVLRSEYRETRDSGYAPILYGFGDYVYQSDSFLLNDDWLQAGVVLQLPLFDGLSTYAKLQRKQKEIAEAIDTHDQRMDDVVLEVKQAYLDVRESAMRIPVAQKSVEQASENLRIVRDQYGEGWVSSTDVIIEEDRLSRARSNYFRALYDYHAAFARLTGAVGGPPPEAPRDRAVKAETRKPQ